MCIPTSSDSPKKCRLGTRRIEHSHTVEVFSIFSPQVSQTSSWSSAAFTPRVSGEICGVRERQQQRSSAGDSCSPETSVPETKGQDAAFLSLFISKHKHLRWAVHFICSSSRWTRLCLRSDWVLSSSKWWRPKWEQDWRRGWSRKDARKSRCCLPLCVSSLKAQVTFNIHPMLLKLQYQ